MPIDAPNVLQKHLLKVTNGAKEAISQEHKSKLNKPLDRLEKRCQALWASLDLYEKSPTEINARRLGMKVKRVRIWLCKTFDISHIESHQEPVH